ncbi:MAG: radical SAM protein [Candidatus Lokiarchaeota archaeon]|nr:radical SAM protein [Candidatus Lokiarchaeota archaeon]
MIFENIIIKDWRKIDISFGLVYPNVYSLGMSSYSIRLLYFLINSFKDIACERIFLPEGIKLKFPASKDYSPKNQLRSIENKVLPNEFDILGFSFHFENDLKNILWILDKVEIPLSFKERQKRNDLEKNILPLIIGGGPVVTSNPMSFSKIFDVLFIGDSECNLKLFFQIFKKYKNEKINYREFLDKISQIEGIFIPSLNNKVKRAILKNLDDSTNPIFQLSSNDPKEKLIFQNNFFVEINRGCPYKCKFCISSFHNSPFRNRSYENIKNIIEDGINYSNFDTISLIGSCVSSHPQFKQICELIINNGIRLTIPSIRIEHLTSDVIQLIEKAAIKTITIAPEAGSESLRFELGKKISNEKIISVLTQIRESQIKNVKFYFLIGLPGEKEENIDDIIKLLKTVDQLGFKRNSLRVSINPFIPKLNTPYEKQISSYLEEKMTDLQKKFQKLERELKSIPSIKVKFRNFKLIIKNARLQTIISLGDQDITEVLLSYYHNGANFGALKKAESEFGFSLNDYLLKIRDCYSPWAI